MAIIPEEAEYKRPTTVVGKFKKLEEEVDILKKGKDTEKESKPFKFPFGWMGKFRKANAKMNNDKVLVLFLNKKNEIEEPKFMPIYDGNMIVYKNKPYEYDPRALWRLKVKKLPHVYLIKETDRRPVSNLNLEEARARGDLTDSDELLIKAALKAQTSQMAGKGNWIIIAIIVLVLVGGLIWLLQSGKLG